MSPSPLISLLLFSTAVSNFGAVGADPVHIPVTRKRSTGVVRDVNYYAAAADRVRAKYGFPTSASSANRKRSGDSAKFGKRASSASISIVNQVGNGPYRRIRVEMLTEWDRMTMLVISGRFPLELREYSSSLLILSRTKAWKHLGRVRLFFDSV